MIRERNLFLETAAGPASLPRISRLAWERADGPRYRHRSRPRSQRHPAVQITLAGTGAVFADDGSIRQRCGVGTALVFLNNEHEVVYGHPGGGAPPWDFVYANLEGTVADLVILDLVAAHGHVLPFDPEHAVVDELLALLDLTRGAAGSVLPRRGRGDLHRRIGAADAARLAFGLLAALVEATTPEAGGEERLLAEAMSFLRARLDEGVDVAAAARHCGVSREHLSRCFARLVGEGPATWLRRQRLAQAERLLQAGDLPVSEVARRCGYASPSHFAQAFRRSSGRTPRGFRRG